MTGKKIESIPYNNSKSHNPAKFIKRKRWKNCVKNQVVEPLQYFEPETLEELINIVKIAGSNNYKVRAVGSGHSFSEILQTTDYLISCSNLNKVIKLDKELLKNDSTLKETGFDPGLLVHVENGISIKNLNEYLDKNKLALPNMGGYDAQTIAGVISTSTHGTGITLGPISDFVVSIILVAEDGIVYRIEPEKGITDPEKYYKHFPDNKLIQDDEWFNAVLVSMGCMGIFYSVILKVTKSYYLKEERIAKVNEIYWEDVKEKIDIKKMLNENRHFEIWINPYKIKGKHRCLITRKNIYTGDIKKLSAGSRMRHWFIEFIIPFVESLIRASFKYFYKLSPKFIDLSMKQVLDYDGYIDKSFNVLHIGNANLIKGYSSEFAISLQNDLYIKAADKILELAEQNRSDGNIYHSAPISLRFVKKSGAFLAMMYGEDKCLIEVPILAGTHGGFRILERIEYELLNLGDIRPHWGQYNQLTKDTVRKLYPELDKWIKIYKCLNKNGTFDNSFTSTCGFRN